MLQKHLLPAEVGSLGSRGGLEEKLHLHFRLASISSVFSHHNAYVLHGSRSSNREEGL